jgi:hypothetical protein
LAAWLDWSKQKTECILDEKFLFIPGLLKQDEVIYEKNSPCLLVGHQIVTVKLEQRFGSAWLDWSKQKKEYSMKNVLFFSG